MAVWIAAAWHHPIGAIICLALAYLAAFAALTVWRNR